MTDDVRLACELVRAVELRRQYDGISAAWLACRPGSHEERRLRAQHGKTLLAYDLCLARINRLQRELRGERWLAVVGPPHEGR